MKNNIKQFNSPSTLAVISPFPHRGETYSKGTTGVASYSKNVVADIDHEVIVFSNYISRPTIYIEDNTFVDRCYSKGSPLMWLDILKGLQKFPQVRTVLIHFDFSMYGSMVTSGLIIPFLLILKLLGYQVSVVAHHVIVDAGKLSGHLGLTHSLEGAIKTATYNIVFNLFNLLLGWVSYQIIVLEEILKNRLENVVPASKIVTIPHAVDTGVISVSKAEARKRLGIGGNDQVVLFFGFVNWFKGADFFVDTFKNITQLLGKNARFIIAGGKSPTMASKPYYNKYFNQIAQTISKSKNVEMTGYVPQEKIKLYFAAADLVVFPYRDLMCASGVLSLTFSYMKPFIVSKEMAELFEETEFKDALKTVGLSKNDVVFDLNHLSLLNQTTNVLADGVKPKLVKLTKIMREKRSFTKTATLYKAALFPILSLGKRLSFDY